MNREFATLVPVAVVTSTLAAPAAWAGIPDPPPQQLFGAGGNGALADEMGGLDALRGKAPWGMGVVLDVWSRRALPCD